MASNAAELRTLVERVLSSRGFAPSPKGAKWTWYRQWPETTVVLNLQKTEFGRHFVNLGVALRALTEASNPREELCQLRMRLDRVVRREEREQVLADFDLGIEDRSGRDARIAGFIQQGAEWLEQFSSGQAIRDQLVASDVIRLHSTVQLREALGLPVERVVQPSRPLIVVGPAPLNELLPKRSADADAKRSSSRKGARTDDSH